MADSKITDLTELTALAYEEDLIEVVDASTSSNKKAKASTVLGPASSQETGASYIFAFADAFKTKVFDSVSAQTATIPTNAAVAYPIGTRIRGFRAGTGSVKFLPDSGVTLRLPTGIKPRRFMGVQAAHAGSLTQNLTTEAAIPYAAADTYDTDDFHDPVTNNTRLTIPAGLGITKVALFANHRDSLNTADTSIVASFRKDGTTYVGMDSRENGFTTKDLALTTLSIPATSGYFEFMVRNETDTSITIASTSYFGLEVTEIDAQGFIAYRYGAIEIEKIGTNEWIVIDQTALG